MEEEESGRQERNSDTPLGETEGVIKKHEHIFKNTYKKWFLKRHEGGKEERYREKERERELERRLRE